jgi:2-(1,2-epoxy-1,2-dihydrophenyl)acetyl-CoA isomerase
MDELLEARAAGPVLVLTLNRPDVRNALNSALVHRLLGALHEAKHDEGVAAVVLTGAPPAFCAGGDLADSPEGADAAALAVRHRAFVELAQAIASLPKPVVAAVNGAAVGAGASLALASDHVVMAGDAALHLSFLAVGLPPDLLSVSLLRNRAGSTVAAHVLYSGRPVSADEAVRLNLANRTAAAGDVVPEAVDAARRLGSLPSFAFATTKSLLRHATTLGDAIVDIEPFAVAAAAASREFIDATARYRR